ncbi:MAG: hypothetical protein N2512_02110 [Armatimonadetes bacterium]|nr:hypothetical protein [Armatimonadota bacterium]
MCRLNGWAVVIVSMFCASTGLTDGRPAILFCGSVDRDYLRELQQKGFEVDYTESLSEATWDRISKFNVLVIFGTPDAYAVVYANEKSSPERVQSFVSLIERYLEAGGGVLLLPMEMNVLKQMVSDLTDNWGVKVPCEIIVESDPEKTGALTHSNQATPLAYTDQVLPSPVSDGVQGVWYPNTPAYNAAMTVPLILDENWQIVVRASQTARTQPVDLTKAAAPIENPIIRAEPEASPPIFALRPYKAGRIAFCCQWPQFSVVAGTKWIYNREVLERGVKGKPSDFGRLLENTYRWLAEPSLESGALGGHVTFAEKLLPPNAREDVKREYKGYEERYWPYDPKALGEYALPENLKLYRGLIGVKSSYSSGTGTVEDYARMARELGLDFLVFMEDFSQLTREEFEQLKADCVRLSDDDLLLLAGFTITSNIGNHLFFFGPDPVWPIDKVLCGPDKSLLYIQEENDKGGFTGYLTPFLDWVLYAGYHCEDGQVGYYNFVGSPTGMRLWECRLYAAVGLRYYKGGKLVEDVTDDYLLTAECTIPPAPMAVNEVTSPEELRREVRAGHALTYGLAQSLNRSSPGGLFMSALRWSHQYDGLPVFVSDGPKILAWPACHRVWTYGGEEFVTAPNVMPSPIYVTAEKGLKEIRIYNGQRLFRRFALSGEKEFKRILVLNGTIQMNLVLIAEDMAGGKAVSFARRCWKDGALAPSFCSDHVNDGGHMWLAHGPNSLPLNYPPALSPNIAGGTWDGGPTGCLPLARYQETVPVIETDQGTEDFRRCNQVPVLDFSDEGAVAVASLRQEYYDERVERVLNPWQTYGPIDGPTKFAENLQYYREWVTPTVDVPEEYWAAPGIRVGVNPSLFTNTVRFKWPVVVKRLRLGALHCHPDAKVVVGTAEGVREVPLWEGVEVLLRPGDWFGLYKQGVSNSHLYVLRSEPVRLKIQGAIEFFADVENKSFRAGDSYTFEIAALGFPVNVEIDGPQDLARYVEYLRAPAGLKIIRGARQPSHGVLTVAVSDGAAELSVPRPATRLDLTLPVCVTGLNPRWSAGLFQVRGYSKGFHGPGENRYRALSVDTHGVAYVPLYVDYAGITHVVAGHPVVAGPEGKDLFIQVTKVHDGPHRWHVSVNNPTARAITTRLRKAMNLPGLTVPTGPIKVPAGGYLVLQ